MGKINLVVLAQIRKKKKRILKASKSMVMGAKITVGTQRGRRCW